MQACYLSLNSIVCGIGRCKYVTELCRPPHVHVHVPDIEKPGWHLTAGVSLLQTRAFAANAMAVHCNGPVSISAHPYVPCKPAGEC